jgi:biopolymer transport protein ExbD
VVTRKKISSKKAISAIEPALISLLLIFFLVTTTIAEDKGITVKLPVWSEEEPDITKLKKRNVYSVLVNAQNQLLVRGELMRVEDLKNNAKEFISNPYNRPDLSEKPTKAIISLKNDRGTEYGTYLAVYNELKAAYNELWDDLAQKKYGVDYSDELPLAWKKAIRDEIPFVISEAEPTAFGEED